MMIHESSQRKITYLFTRKLSVSTNAVCYKLNKSAQEFQYVLTRRLTVENLVGGGCFAFGSGKPNMRGMKIYIFMASVEMISS